MTPRSRLRFLAMAVTLAALALGLWTALDLIGWRVAPIAAALPGAHGVLMVNGVLASLIGVERAVALGRRPYYAAPLLTAFASVGLALGTTPKLAFEGVTAGAAALLVLFAIILRRQPALYTATMALGAACLVVGDYFGSGGTAIFELIPWWGSFLVLVIAAERLELTRVVRQTAFNRGLFAFTAALGPLGAAISTVAFSTGFMLAAAGWLLVAVWLIFHDLAWWNLDRAGLPRFTAVSLLLGFAWLLVGGGLILIDGGVLAGLAYDAGLHAIFLGFVLSLVFAHALVIVPAVLGRPIPFHAVLYVPVGMLELSLVARVYADLANDPVLREWAGLFNVGAIVLFGALLPALYLRGRSVLADAVPLELPMVHP